MVIRLFWVLLATMVSCGDGPTLPALDGPVDLTTPWVVAAPADMGADASLLAEGIELARGNHRLLSLLVIKDGRLVVEEYFRGNHADSLNDVRSVTKSVVSALAGIALDRGFFGSLDDSIGKYLPPDVAILDSDQQAIRIRHLLTMTSGFDWNEDGGFGSYIDWILSADHIDHLLDQPIVHAPGTFFQYNSAAVHLLGVVLEEATGMSLPQFADVALFEAVGIRRRAWEPLTRGYHNGGAGLDLRPRDLARFGQLFLQDGRSGDNTVLPAAWPIESSQPRFAWRFAYGPLGALTYGYLWWVVTSQPEPAYYAWGFGGQFIYLVPDIELVAVTTTEWRNVSLEGGPEPFEIAALQVIAQYLVPAFRVR